MEIGDYLRRAFVVDSGTSKNDDSNTKKIVDSGTNKTVDSCAKKNVNPGCRLYHGQWVHDSAGPLYSNNSCLVLSQMQKCQEMIGLIRTTRIGDENPQNVTSLDWTPKSFWN